MRSGKWKLHLRTARGNGAGASSLALYDLEADIGEKTNVLAEHPEIEERLLSYVKAFEEDLAQNSRPAAFVEEAKPLTFAD